MKIETQTAQPTRPREKQKPQTKTHWGCIFFLLILLAAGGVGGFYAYEFMQQKDLERAEYLKLNGCTNPEVYNNFIARFPNSKYVNKVREQLKRVKGEDDDFRQVLRSDNIHQIRRYLIAHPDTRFRRECEVKLDTLEYKEAIESNSLEGLRDYISTHPSSPFLDAARSKVKELERNTVSDQEKSRIRNVADRFVYAMNNGDDTGLGYILDVNFAEFNGRDTTATSFGRDIMVYVNEQIFMQDEAYLIALDGPVSATKVPVDEINTYRYDVSFRLRLCRQEEDQLLFTGQTHTLRGTLTNQYQFTRLSLE